MNFQLIWLDFQHKQTHVHEYYNLSTPSKGDQKKGLQSQ